MSRIYIFKHHTDNMIKVGKTTVRTEGRFKDYVSKHSLQGFTISKEYPVDPGLLNKIESRAHNILADKRFQSVTRARELFLCSVDEAIKAVEQAIKDATELDKSTDKKSIIEVTVSGKTYTAKSLADLARKADITPSTLIYYHRKKGNEISQALRLALGGRKREAVRKANRKLIVFREEFENVSELAKSNFNKLKIDKKTLQKRIYQQGIAPEKALKVPVKPRRKTQSLILPDGVSKTFSSIKAGHDYLKQNFDSVELNALTTVVEYLSRGMEPEVAYGIKDADWKSKNSNLDEFLADGYRLTGELKPTSKPIIVHRDKEIFSSQKEFCTARDFDPSDVSKEIKAGMTAEQITDKRKTKN